MRNINSNNNADDNTNNNIQSNIHHCYGRIYYNMSLWPVLERNGVRYKHKWNDKRDNT